MFVWKIFRRLSRQTYSTILLFPFLILGCGAEPESLSTLAVAEDICATTDEPLSAYTSVQLGGFQILRIEDDPCHRQSRGFGLQDQGSKPPQSVQDALIVSFGDDQLQQQGPPMVVRQPNGVNTTIRPENERMVGQGAAFAQRTLEGNGVATHRIHNPTNQADLQRQVEQLRQNGDLSQNPLVVFHGHHTDDGQTGRYVRSTATPTAQQPHARTPQFFDSTEGTRSVFRGLGRPDHMVCLHSGCQTGAVPGRIAADSEMGGSVHAAGASQQNQLAWGRPTGTQQVPNPNGQGTTAVPTGNMERVFHNVVQGTSPDYARQNDPNGDGVFTYREALGQQLPNTTQVSPTQVYMPGGAGWQQVEDPMRQFGTAGAEHPSGPIGHLERGPDGSMMRSTLPSQSRQVSFPQNPTTYQGDQVVLGRYPTNN